MKRILSIALLFLLCAAGLQAQNALDTFKKSMKGKRAMVEFDIDAEMSGTDVRSQGFAIFEGARFLLSSHELQVYCDGKSVWIMDMKAEEVTIEEGSLDLDALISNGSLSTKGDRITAFEYEDAEGTRVRLTVTDYEFMDEGSASDFTPDLSRLSKRWIITDLR